MSASRRRLAAQRDGVRRAAGGAGRVACSRPRRSRPVTAVGPRLDVQVPADDQVGAAALERGVAQVGVVDQRSCDPLAVLVGLAGRVGEPVGDLVEASARSRRASCPRPLERGSPTPSSRTSAGPVDDLAVEDGPAVVGEVAADERAVVVVAGDRPPPVVVRLVVEGGARASRARTPPRCCRSRCRRRRRRPRSAPAASATARATAVHADVVVPVGDEQDHGLAVLGSPQVELGGRPRRRRGRTYWLFVVGVDRALDQPSGLAGGDVAADLDARRAPRAPARRGRGTPASGTHSSPAAEGRRRRRATAGPAPASTTPDATTTTTIAARAPQPGGELAAPVPADQHPDHAAARRRGPRPRTSRVDDQGRRAPRGPGPPGPRAGRRSARSARRARRCVSASVLPRVTSTPTRPPESTRTSGSTGPVRSTT